VDPTQYPGDYFVGSLEDVRIYSYGLSQSEIQDIAKLGENVIPNVSVVADPCAYLVLSVSDSVTLDSTAFDLNNDPISYKWTVEDPCADVVNSVTFIPGDAVADPQAVFAKAGTYTIRVNVDDGQAGFLHGGAIFADITIIVSNPTCQDVLNEGLGLAADISGPNQGERDCHVDVHDLAAIGSDWLRCVDPLNPVCENPFAD
jgi:hypothetical protein